MKFVGKNHASYRQMLKPSHRSFRCIVVGRFLFLAIDLRCLPRKPSKTCGNPAGHIEAIAFDSERESGTIRRFLGFAHPKIGSGARRTGETLLLGMELGWRTELG